MSWASVYGVQPKRMPGKYSLGGTKRRALFARAAASKARASLVRAQRGFVRTAGYYRGRRSGSGQELKFKDTTVPAALSLLVGTIHSSSLVTIPQDGTESGRVGRKITVKSIHVRGLSVLAGTTDENNTDDTIRLMLVLDKQANGTAPAVTDILETASIDSFNNLANKSRFRILKDTKLVLNSAMGAIGVSGKSGNRTIPFEWHIKNLDLPIEYDNTAPTGALATVRSNNLVVLGISSDQTATVRYTARVRYTD